MTTRFLRKKVRQQIRDNDSLQRVYPSLLRSPFFVTSSIKNTAFDDTTTISYVTQNTTFPAMLPVGYNAELTSSIKSVVNFAASAVENKVKLYSDLTTPFNESLLNIPGTSAYTVTSSIVPGFNTPVRNKLAISIDLTSTREKFLFRLGATDTTDPAGLFYGQSSSGFSYYNFNRKCWEDIGLNEATPYVGHMGDVSAGPTGFNGQNYFMSQFVGTNNALSILALAFPTADPDGIARSIGYQHIGAPWEFFDAPAAPRYHATSSQGLQLTGYIRQPFVLEQIDVTLPFVARKKLGPPRTGGAYAEGALRDIDNLVFFMYRQDGDVSDATRSIRRLIAHESLSFYPNLAQSSSFTIHNPVFSHEYTLTDVYDTTEKIFTGSVSFTMKPKVSSTRFTGITSFCAINPAPATANVAGYWSGPIASALTGTANGITAIGTFYKRTLNNYTEPEAYTSFIDVDTRFLVNNATSEINIPPAGFGADYASQNYSTVESPYILLPTDRLIFGVECGIQTVREPAIAYGKDASHLSHTGSFFKLLTGEAKVTLFGSLIQNNSAKPHNSIDQNLVSPAVHEIITNVQDDSDQYLVAEKSVYQGGYLSNYVSGSFFDGTRRVYDDLATTKQTILSASFGRFAQFNNSNKVYYDCLAPDPREYAALIGASYNNTFDLISLVRYNATDDIFSFESNPAELSFPYLNSTKRALKLSTRLTAVVGFSFPSHTYEGLDAKQLLFYAGKKVFNNIYDPYATSREIILNLTGSSAIRYGMKNIINENPKSIFRPDRYGQFRDMLEQAQDSALYDLSNIKKNQDPPIIINFVTASSDDPVEPSTTTSNNFSKYSTSSLPYFDGLNRSRPDYTVTKNSVFSPKKLVFKT